MEMENEAYLIDFGEEKQSNKYFTVFKNDEDKNTYESNKNI